MEDKTGAAAEPKVALEMAEAELDRFAEEMDLDLDTADMDAEDLAQFTKLRKRLLHAIQKGALVINDNGEAVYTPQNRKSKHQDALTFRERTGASLMAMDGKKKNYDVTKTYAVMADMCKVHPNVFAGLVGIDAKICEALFALLMD
jgi:Zn-finger domain-containing protein